MHFHSLLNHSVFVKVSLQRDILLYAAYALNDRICRSEMTNARYVFWFSCWSNGVLCFNSSIKSTDWRIFCDATCLLIYRIWTDTRLCRSVSVVWMAYAYFFSDAICLFSLLIFADCKATTIVSIVCEFLMPYAYFLFWFFADCKSTVICKYSLWCRMCCFLSVWLVKQLSVWIFWHLHDFLVNEDIELDMSWKNLYFGLISSPN